MGIVVIVIVIITSQPASQTRARARATEAVRSEESGCEEREPVESAGQARMDWRSCGGRGYFWNRAVRSVSIPGAATRRAPQRSRLIGAADVAVVAGPHVAAAWLDVQRHNWLCTLHNSTPQRSFHSVSSLSFLSLSFLLVSLFPPATRSPSYSAPLSLSLLLPHHVRSRLPPPTLPPPCRTIPPPAPVPAATTPTTA